MANFVIRLLVNAVALLAVAYLLKPGVEVTSFTGAIVAAIILGIVNAVLKPILTLITLPLVIVTLGLFTLVINGIVFYIVGHLHLGLEVHGFGTAIVGALILSIVSYLLNLLLKDAQVETA